MPRLHPGLYSGWQAAIICASMLCQKNVVGRAGGVLLLGLLLLPLRLPAQSPAASQTNSVLRMMSANLNGNTQVYQPFALRIFQGLKPDIVAIQEFNYGNNTPADFRAMLDTAFGTDFVYYRESGYNIPNGIISRYPIVASGSWDDPLVNDRGFAWAEVDLPGTNDLFVVSVHLYSGGTTADRNTEATTIKNLIAANFPPDAWVVVAGDFNTGTRSEPALSTFKTFLSDSPIPTDAESGGDADTNEPRSKPYDYVLPSYSLAALLTNCVFASRTFPNGLVFDSRVYTPLSDVAPVQYGDSSNAQHMAVIKDFAISGSVTPPPTGAPSIATQPQSQTVNLGNDATFSVVANGTAPLAYQWRFNGGDIPGATATSYTRANVQTTDAGTYSVLVSNAQGTATSAPAVLSVVPAPSGPIIAQWNFNSTPPDGSTTTGATTPSVGNGTAALVGGTTQTFASGSTMDPAASGSDNSAWNTATYPAQGSGNKSAGVQFNVSTAGRENIQIRWDQRASNTGSKYVRLQYATNGATFVDFPTATAVASTSFEARTNDLSAIPGVANNTHFAFRIVAEFESTATGSGTASYVGAGGTYGSAGTIRFDMVTVSGTAIPVTPPASANLSAFSYNTNCEFQLDLAGTTGAQYVIQAATDLSRSNWTSLLTNTAPFRFSDTNAGAASQRFYRALALP